MNKLQKMGCRWADGKLPTRYIPKTCHHITVHDDKKMTYCGDDSYFYDYEKTTAKNFLQNECVVIYRDGNATVALDKRTDKKAIARCCPEDTYKFMTGAKLAFDRLTAPREDKKSFSPYLEMAVHGKAEQYGSIGDKTPITDAIGRKLYVGDVVELYNENNVFCGEYPVVKKKKHCYVMGIKCMCDSDGTITNGYKIILKRKHDDVENGEIVEHIRYVKERGAHNE